MKWDWSSTHEGGGRGQFTSAKNTSADRKDLNTLIASSAEKCLKNEKICKVKTKDDPDSDSESENFNFEKLYISADSNSE